MIFSNVLELSGKVMKYLVIGFMFLMGVVMPVLDGLGILKLVQ